MVGAIVSGSVFGDNLAPISDTTIASALTQGAEVRDVVRTRLPYSLIGGVVSAILFVIIGFRTTDGGMVTELVDVSYAKSLVLLIIPVIMIILMLKGWNLISTLVICDLAGFILCLALGLITPSTMFSAAGPIGGGITSMLNVICFSFFIFVLLEMLTRSGVFEVFEMLLEKASSISKSPRSAELTCVLICIVASIATGAASISILVIGPIVKKLFKPYNLEITRASNIMDGFCTGLGGCIPYNPISMNAVSLAIASGVVGESFSFLDYLPYNFHSMMLFILFLISILTGIGRRFEKTNGEAK